MNYNRNLKDWNIYKEGSKYIVLKGIEKQIEFDSKEEAEKYALLNFYKDVDNKLKGSLKIEEAPQYL